MKKFLMFFIVSLFYVPHVYAFSLFGDRNIELVKEGVLSFDKGITIGGALDNYKYFYNHEWKSFDTEQGRTIVEFCGNLDYKTLVSEYYRALNLIDPCIKSSLLDEFYKWFKNKCTSEIKLKIQFAVNKNNEDFQMTAIGFESDGENYSFNEFYSDLTRFINSIWQNQPIEYAWSSIFSKEFQQQYTFEILEKLEDAEINQRCFVSYKAHPISSLAFIHKINRFTIQLNLFLIEKEKWEDGRTEVFLINGDYTNCVYPFNSNSDEMLVYYEGDFGKIEILYNIRSNIITGLSVCPIKFSKKEWVKMKEGDYIGLKTTKYEIINEDMIKTVDGITVSLLSLAKRAENISEENTESAISGSKKGNNKLPLAMTDELYEKFTENNEFCLSETILNETWRYIKLLLNKSKYQEVLKEQKEWLAHGRDTAANQYATQISDVSAYTKANFERADELAKIITSKVIPGEYIYSDGDGGMIIRKTSNNAFEAKISTTYKQNICEANVIFENSETGWAKIKDDTPDDSSDDIYFLFLPQKVFVYTQMSSYYCGMNASMDGEYALQ